MGDLLAVDEALERLSARRPELGKLVSLRFFAGLPMPEIAEILRVPLRTLEREWKYARSWLQEQMSGGV